MKKLTCLFFMFFLVSLAGCNSVTPLERFRGQSAESIYKGGVHDMLHHDYSGAADHFEALNAMYPFNKYAEQAQLNEIYAYYRQDDTASALASADRYIHLYPSSKNIDYAYYMRGLTSMGANKGIMEKIFPYDPSTRDLSSMKKAYMDFDVLLKSFPHSKYTPDAVQRMRYIRNLVARHTLEVASFYYAHKAYVASANRANDVVIHFQETPSVPSALVLMVKSYRQLGLTDQANQALATLKANFPGKVSLLKN